MAVRIVNLRKHIELTTPRFADSNVYQVVSNIVHERDRNLSR